MGSIKSFNLPLIIENYNLKYFVETGTYYGDGILHASTFNFEKVFSVEIEPSIFEKTLERLKDKSNIELSLDESGKYIQNLINSDKIEGNTLFFLDAHFPGADASIRGYADETDHNINIPLLRELTAIKQRVGKFNDVIVIDDLRLFKDDTRIQYWDVDAHWRNIGQPANKKDLVKFDLLEICREFFPNHMLSERYDEEGYLTIHNKI